MNKMARKFTISLNKNVLISVVVGILVILGVVFALTGKGSNGKETTDSIVQVYESLSRTNPNAAKLFFEQSDRLTKEVDPRLIELDQLTIGCFGPDKIMQMKETDPNLGGQCCGSLKNAEQYKIQLGVIEDFIEEHEEHLGDNVNLIPKDPYDVSVELAKKLMRYDNEIKLTIEQQVVYDKAVQLSHHGGPCCCRCWKWYVMSGLAKKLIVDNDFTAEQTAELWDLSSSCGHDEDVNMHQHYKRGAGAHVGHNIESTGTNLIAELNTNPQEVNANVPAIITFNLKDSKGNLVKDLMISHEKVLHTVIMSEDFSVFVHIHPEDFGNIDEMKENGAYSVKFTFPKAGKYVIAIDFMVNDEMVAKQFIVDVKGEPELDELNPDFSREIDVDGYSVKLSTSPEQIASGKETIINYRIEKDGEPVTDLEPYLGAPMHVAVVSSDLKNFMHTHGELESSEMHGGMMHQAGNNLPNEFGPEIKAYITFAKKGTYFVAGELKHKGNVIVTKFMIDVK